MAVIRVACTTSIFDSGLYNVIETAFENYQGGNPPAYTLQWNSVGSGAAMQAARNGLADVVLSHDRIGEFVYLAELFGLSRVPFCYNFFVMVGAAQLPAPDGGVGNATTLADCYKSLSQNSSLVYVSRGANGLSGTYVREQQILTLSNITGINVQNPPVSNPGMMATLSDTYQRITGTGPYVGNAQNAYTLTDIGTLYQFYAQNLGSSSVMIILTSATASPEDPDASNQYVVMDVNPNACFLQTPNPAINTAGAQAFIAWLQTTTSQGTYNAQDTINGYKSGGNQGFIWNAGQERFPGDVCILKPVPPITVELQ